MFSLKRAWYEEEEINEDENMEDSNENLAAKDHDRNAITPKIDNLANYLKTEKISINLDERLTTHIRIMF